jgi:hypothetical protein
MSATNPKSSQKQFVEELARIITCTTTALEITALEESIEKWRQVERGEMPDMGKENCSLCMEFVKDSCIRCPVNRYTGASYCTNTPYRVWMLQVCATANLYERVADTPERVQAARAEKRFLQEVLRWVKYRSTY